ncbi:MAG: hypothetical protein M0P31_09580 [Solirubrobacteraceae bacterium]|nr:hypothetical protein [Solirubrobacteraceae bacterium]
MRRVRRSLPVLLVGGALIVGAPLPGAVVAHAQDGPSSVPSGELRPLQDAPPVVVDRDRPADDGDRPTRDRPTGDRSSGDGPGTDGPSTTSTTPDRPRAGERSGRSAGSDRRSAASDRADDADPPPDRLADTGLDLRGLGLLGVALVLAGTGLRLRTGETRW